jgi:hypothetical protein
MPAGDEGASREAFQIFGMRRPARRPAHGHDHPMPSSLRLFRAPPHGNCTDQDNDGVVSAAELKRMMKAMGNEMTDEEVRDIMKEIGSSQSIDYSAWVKLLGLGIKQSRSADSDPEEEMQHAFALFDRDRDGVITPQEMRTALAGFGVQLTEREVDQVRWPCITSAAVAVAAAAVPRPTSHPPPC